MTYAVICLGRVIGIEHPTGIFGALLGGGSREVGGVRGNGDSCKYHAALPVLLLL